MKQLVVALICAVFTLSTVYAQDAKKKKDTVTFFVEGMECANCQKKVEKNISFEKGVTDMKCDLTTRTVEVTYKTDKTSKTSVWRLCLWTMEPDVLSILRKKSKQSISVNTEIR